MNNEPRQRLGEIITEYGQDAYNPQRCEGLLRDYCGQYKKEIFLIVNALKKGVVGELIKSNKENVALTIVLARLTKKLQDELGITEESALWAVDTWGLALGIISQPRSIEPPDLTKKLDLPEPPQPILRKIYIWAILSTLTAVCLGIAYYLNVRDLNDTKFAYEQRINRLDVNIAALDREHQNAQNTLEDLEKNLTSNLSPIFLATDTEINFCNKSSADTIRVAFMYHYGSQLRSVGWWEIIKGKCRKISMFSKHQGIIYIHGEIPKTHDIEWGSKDSSFCATRHDDFDIIGAGKEISCIGENRLVNANKFMIFPGVNNYTFKDYQS